MNCHWSFITVTYNSESKLRAYWDQPLGEDVEWIVVDNHSNDASCSVAVDLGAKVVPLNQNLGFSRANNIGLRLAQGDYVAFLNPDVRPLPATLPRLRAEIDNRNGLALVAPQLLSDDGSLQPNGRGEPYLLNKVMHRICPQAVDNSYRLFADPGTIREVSWLMGAAVICRRDVVRSFGGWPEEYFIYYEDTDLGLEMRDRGIPSYIVGDVQWIHGWARDTARFNFRAWTYELRSMLRFYSRHPRYLSPIPRTKS